MAADTTPLWIWLPGQVDPVQAGTLQAEPGAGRLTYAADYLKHPQALAPDPVSLHLSRKAKGLALTAADGLPGVVRDAMPAGYGADVLTAAAGRPLSALELLERGAPDAVGALELCHDIERKLAWTPHTFESLKAIIEDLEADAPASRAIRRLNDDAGTSAGGERPKVTLMHQGQQWLAKMQDRGDLPAMPAREYAVMSLARQVGLSVPPVDLQTMGPRQVFLIQRFDRAGDPRRPTRRLFASAHTVLNLSTAAVRGDPARSYLVLADQVRIWCHGHPALADHLRELWQRMAFNALVGNIDDHPRNHGLLHDGQHWALAPAFDVTPVLRQPPPGALARHPGVSLAMDTGPDGTSLVDAERLLACCGHFGWDLDGAAAWLTHASAAVATQWEACLRSAAAPALRDQVALDALVDDCRCAFELSESLATSPEVIVAGHEAAAGRVGRRRVAKGW